MLLHDAGPAESDLRSLLSQAGEGAQPSASAALTDSGTLAGAAGQMLDHDLPPSCVPHRAPPWPPHCATLKTRPPA
jgi:hypothetical protein